MNKLIKAGILIILTTALLQSCGTDERQTSSGFAYTVIREGKGKMPVDEEWLILEMEYGVGDSVWVETGSRGPVPLQKNDSLWNSAGVIYEIFSTLREGDSVAFSVDAETLFTETWKQSIPPDLSPQTMFDFKISLDTVLSTEDYSVWYQRRIDEENRKLQAQQEEQFEKDMELLEAYFAENNIDPIESESGLHYVIHEKGTGEEANPSDTVSVMYKGYLLNGEVFDTNIEEVARENGMYSESNEYAPLDFVIGRSRVIRGWHEGIDSLSVGSRATLYIPSRLGYGPYAQGPRIPANTVLLFDVELVDVKK